MTRAQRAAADLVAAGWDPADAAHALGRPRAGTDDEAVWLPRINAAAELFGLTAATMRSRLRPAAIVRVRHAIGAALLASGVSSTRAGWLLRRDHSAILYARKEARPPDVARVLALWRGDAT